MIRDPAFNDLFAPQPAPWGAHGVKPLGYLIPMTAVREEIPSEEIHGILKDSDAKSPMEQLQDYCHGQALLEGTWLNLPQAIQRAYKLSIPNYAPLPPYVIDRPQTPEDDLGQDNGLHVGIDDEDEEVRAVGGNHKWNERMPDTFLWHEAVTAQPRGRVDGKGVDGRERGGWMLEDLRDDPNFAAH